MREWDFPGNLNGSELGIQEIDFLRRLVVSHFVGFTACEEGELSYERWGGR